MAVQNLQPQIKALKERYSDEAEKGKLNAELSALYTKYGVNPLAGCFPVLVTLPVFWGLYRALINSAASGSFNVPFWWIPSLAGPTYVAFPGNSGGLSWLWPLDPVTGAPPIGWHDAGLYAALPLALVASQYVATVLLPTPTPDSEEDAAKQETSKALLKVVPLFVGFFSAVNPAGLGLYWLANNVLTTATTYQLKYLGGAQARRRAEGCLCVLVYFCFWE